MAFTLVVATFRTMQRVECHKQRRGTNNAFCQCCDKLSQGQHKQLSFIAKFTVDIQHISGKDNGVADVFFCVSAVKMYP